MMKKITALLFLSFFSVAVFAQSVWNWGEDEKTAKEKNAMYSDSYKTKNYGEAAEHLDWLLENTPDLNPSIYIKGAKIFEEISKTETDAAKKEELRQKALQMYDKRIEYFGKEVDVLNRKAFAAYRFYSKDKSKYGDLFTLYEQVLEKSGENIHDNNLLPYWNMLYKYKNSGGEVSDETALDRYSQLNEIMDAKLKAGAKTATISKIKEVVDKLLPEVASVDCDFIQNNFGEKLKADPENINLAKKIMSLSLAGGCGDNPAFLDAAIALDKLEPNFGVAKVIAIKKVSAGDIEGGFEYYNKAIELADDDKKKADIYYDMAIQEVKRKRKVSARSYAMKAAAADQSVASKSYKLVGDLYLGSFSDCKKGERKVEDRAVYIAAYNMYKKAGNKKMMDAAEAQFPSIDDIFTETYEEGQTIQVGCWIKEAVTIRRRPST